MNEKNKAIRGIVLRILIAFILTVLFGAAGAVVRTKISEETQNLFGFLALGLLALLLLLIVFNLIASRCYKKSKELTVRQQQEYYMTRKEEATRDLPRAVRKITRLRRAIQAYTVLILLFSLFLAFAMGIGTEESFRLPIIPLYLLYGFCSRIRVGKEKFSFEGYTDPNDYPRLHALAHRAAKALGKDGEIRIALLSNCNAGIAKLGRTYSLQLGTLMLDVLSEEELYQVLLHEFAHLTKDANPVDRERRLFDAIAEREDTPLVKILNCLFLFPDILYIFEYVMYRQFSSASIEAIADRAVIRHGDPQTAVNALAKIAFGDFFDREMDDFVEEHFFAPEEARTDAGTILCDAFRRAIAQREPFWRELLRDQIEPRNASHPIFRNRMAALGVEEFCVTLPTDAGEFRDECNKAIGEISRKIHEASVEDYAEQREERYLKPLKRVEEWRSMEQETPAEEARPVMDALQALGYDRELETWCDRLLEVTENVYAIAHVHYVKGQLLLKRYDKAGIDHIYRAIELNTNYIENGLEQIGEYCCLTGLQAELDEYRERSLELHQLQEDQYSETGELRPSDRVQTDSMPTEMLEKILSFMHQVSDGQIERVYLVRKIITEEFFSSIFIVRFKENADRETVGSAMEKIFNYLDTWPEDYQFSLFYYEKQYDSIIKRVANSCVYSAQDGE